MTADGKRTRQQRYRANHPAWAAGQIANLKGRKRRKKHGDDGDKAHGDHGDGKHGDAPAHGDDLHGDTGRPVTMSDTTGHGDGAREPEAVLGDQRIDAQADIDCLKALAATLDGLIAKSGATDARLRLRMDYARTLSVLRDRLRRLPEPKPTGSLTDRVTARWLASKAALSAALPATPAIPPAPISHDTLAPEDAPAPAVLDF